MIRDMWEQRDYEPGQAGSAGSANQWAARAAALATEFRAPVGILDTRLRCWCSVVGALESLFPEIDEALVRTCRSGELIHGRALCLAPPRESKRVWLLLHVSDFAVAVVGFLAGDESQPGTAEWDESWEECSQSGVTWGPVCAEPALRAWGEQVAARIRQAGARAAVPDSGSRLHQSDGDKGVAINRLTRRLRISDPPHHFQTVATTVLRTSLNLIAVAWVPRDPHEQVVVSGEIPGVSVQAYRGFPAPRGTIRRFSALMARQRKPKARPRRCTGMHRSRQARWAGCWRSIRSTTARSRPKTLSGCSTSGR